MSTKDIYTDKNIILFFFKISKLGKRSNIKLFVF